MTVTQISPPREALAESVLQALDALRSAGELAAGLGEQTTLTTRLAIAVKSAAEVDAVAADMDVKASWTAPWTYQAAWTEGTVTVTVAFTTDPFKAPASLAVIESICGQEAGDIPGRAA
jgi:beta-phosphoglucomutase-like phosphatase (HAD superfamily)